MKTVFCISLCLMALLNVAIAQNKIEKKEIIGNTYTVCQNFPPEILGKYLYEQKGEPIVLLNGDGTGLFQAHGVAPVQIKYWIDCDEEGNLRKKEGYNGRYQFTLLFQYEEGALKGNYDLMAVAVAKDLGYAIILGERYKSL